MTNTGAYSKRYQTIEREKMRELKDREKKFGKERSLFLSIQTSQRQKIMEEKKRSMAKAEDERRRKALEDRRQSQQQATDRFRSAMDRIKSSRNQKPLGKNLNILGFKPNRCSSFHDSEDSYLVESNQDIEKSDTERLAMGKEVEIIPEENSPYFGLQKKSSSLDDVNDQLKGSEYTSSDLIDHISAQASEPTTFSGDKRKSASDSNLAHPQAECHDYLNSDNAIFHPAIRNRAPTTTSKDSRLEITTYSPTATAANCTNHCSVEEFCCSPPVPDSLNSSVTELKKTTVNYEVKQRPLFEDHPVVDESDISTTDSIEESSNTSPSLEGLPVTSKPAIVGILKKSNRPSYMNHYSKLPQESCNGVLNRNRGNFSRSKKRVRFSDQVEEFNSPVVGDSVHIELWKKLFPKEFSIQSVPNSAFTPKMRCSLSSKLTPSQQGIRTLKRAPHPVPLAVVDYSTEVGPNTNCDSNIETKHTDSSEAIGHELDKTPTDSEINTMWDQIRQCLQDDRRVSVPPRVFNFKPPAESSKPTLTTNYRTGSDYAKLPNAKSYGLTPSSGLRKNSQNYTTQKQLVYRQPNQSRMVRPRNDSFPPHPVRVPGPMQYAVPVKQEALLKHSNIQSSSKEPSKSTESYNASITDLSLEEKRLMQSIERINQQLKDGPSGSYKDRLKVTDASESRAKYYCPVPPSTPPKRPLTQTHTAARVLTEVKSHPSSKAITSNFNSKPTQLPFHKHIT